MYNKFWYCFAAALPVIAVVQMVLGYILFCYNLSILHQINHSLRNLTAKTIYTLRMVAILVQNLAEIFVAIWLLDYLGMEIIAQIIAGDELLAVGAFSVFKVIFQLFQIMLNTVHLKFRFLKFQVEMVSAGFHLVHR